MMEITLGWLLVVIFVSNRFPSAVCNVSDLDIKNGTFQILQKHPQLKKCADSVLREDRYVGCRVSELTGQCQGLIHSWGLSQTIEQGYAYAKKVFVQESFQQRPFAVENAHIWTIPVVFNKGAQIDISMSKWSQEGKLAWVGISLTNASSEENNLYQIWFSTWISPTYLQFYEEIGKYPNELNTTQIDPVTLQVFSKEMLKFTFVAQSNSVAVFFDDEEVKTIKISAPAHAMRKISVTTLEPRVLIHSLKFTGK